MLIARSLQRSPSRRSQCLAYLSVSVSFALQRSSADLIGGEGFAESERTGDVAYICSLHVRKFNPSPTSTTFTETGKFDKNFDVLRDEIELGDHGKILYLSVGSTDSCISGARSLLI